MKLLRTALESNLKIRVKWIRELWGSRPYARPIVEIVRTPDTMGGFPRLEGRRIGVHHIVPKAEAYDRKEAAVVPLDIIFDAVRAAVEYSEEHPW